MENSPIAIITGDCQSGKTTLLLQLVHHLQDANKQVGGIVALGLWQDNLRSGFDLYLPATNKTQPLARRMAIKPVKGIPFQFMPKAILAGEQALSIECCHMCDMVVVDEIGPYELAGKGWSQSIDSLAQQKDIKQVWIVRKSIIEQVCMRWQIQEPLIVHVDDEDPVSALNEFMSN